MSDCEQYVYDEDGERWCARYAGSDWDGEVYGLVSCSTGERRCVNEAVLTACYTAQPPLPKLVGWESWRCKREGRIVMVHSRGDDQDPVLRLPGTQRTWLAGWEQVRGSYEPVPAGQRKESEMSKRVRIKGTGAVGTVVDRDEEDAIVRVLTDFDNTPGWYHVAQVEPVDPVEAQPPPIEPHGWKSSSSFGGDKAEPVEPQSPPRVPRDELLAYAMSLKPNYCGTRGWKRAMVAYISGDIDGTPLDATEWSDSPDAQRVCLEQMASLLALYAQSPGAGDDKWR